MALLLLLLPGNHPTGLNMAHPSHLYRAKNMKSSHSTDIVSGKVCSRV